MEYSLSNAIVKNNSDPKKQLTINSLKLSFLLKRLDPLELRIALQLIFLEIDEEQTLLIIGLNLSISYHNSIKSIDKPIIFNKK